MGGLAPKKRALPKEKNPLATRVAALEKETVRLKAPAQRAEALVELPKKSPRSWGSNSGATERRAYGDRCEDESEDPLLLPRSVRQTLPTSAAFSSKRKAFPLHDTAKVWKRPTGTITTVARDHVSRMVRGL